MSAHGMLRAALLTAFLLLLPQDDALSREVA
jgi:hypothetical protein